MLLNLLALVDSVDRIKETSPQWDVPKPGDSHPSIQDETKDKVPIEKNGPVVDFEVKTWILDHKMEKPMLKKSFEN